MEVKATQCVPYWLSCLIGKLGCVFQSHSKYCNALEDGDPVLHAQLGGRTQIQYGVVPPLCHLDDDEFKGTGVRTPVAEAS